MSANLPPLPRGRRMGSGVINGKLIELFMHDDAAMTSYATAALSAQAAEVEALRADAERYRIWRHEFTGNESDEATPVIIALNDAWTPEAVDAVLDAARAALKEQTPPSQQKEPTE